MEPDDGDYPGIRRDWNKLDADQILTLIENGDISEIEELEEEEYDELRHYNILENSVAAGL